MTRANSQMRDILILQKNRQRLMTFVHEHAQTVVKLREKIRTLTQEQGELLEERFNSDLLHIMQEILMMLRGRIQKVPLLG